MSSKTYTTVHGLAVAAQDVRPDAGYSRVKDEADAFGDDDNSWRSYPRGVRACDRRIGSRGRRVGRRSGGN